MIRLSILFLIDCLILCQSNVVLSQWIDKGDYKELAISDNTIELFSPNQGSYFYVLNNLKQLNKYDFDGNLHRSIDIPASKGELSFHSVNPDGQYLFYNKFEDRIAMFDSESGDSVWNHNNYEKIIPVSQSKGRFENFLYDEFNDFIILSLSDYYIRPCSTQYFEAWEGGRTFIKKNINKDNEVSIHINDGKLELFETDIYQNKFMLIGVYYHEWAYYNNSPFIMGETDKSYYFQKTGILINLKERRSSHWDSWDKAFKYKWKNQSDGFIEVFKNNVKFHDFIAGMLIQSETLSLQFAPVNIVFSANDKYLIATDADNTIYIIDTKNRNIIRKYPGNVAEMITQLKLTIPGMGFFVSTNKGKLRLYELSMLTAIDEQLAIEEIHISPNPARDYFDISVPNVILSEAKDLVIRIYDMLGVEQELSFPRRRESTEPLRIYISHLSPGVYFIRVGDVVRKFVKI